MKKIITILIILLLVISKSANSQVAEIVPKVGDFTGVTTVSVHLHGFTLANSNKVGAITLKIGFDPNVVSYLDVSSPVLSDFNANVVGNEIIIAWSNTTPVSIDGEAFVLSFHYIDGTCSLSFNEGCEIGRGDGSLITTTYTGGNINHGAYTSVANIAIPSYVAGSWLTGNEVAITFADSPSPSIDDVGAFTFNISYDTNKLIFVGLLGDFSDATANASNGIIHIAWSATNPINLVGKNLKLKFNYLWGSSAINFVGLNSISNAIGNAIPAHFASTGGISEGVCAKTLIIEPGAGGSLSGVTQVDVNFSGTTPWDIGSVTLHISYDNTSLNFVGVSMSGMVANANNGIIDIAWSNTSSAAFSGFTLYFNYIGGTSDLSFTGFNQISDLFGNVLPVCFDDGNVTQPTATVKVGLTDVPVSVGAGTVNVPLYVSCISSNCSDIVNAATIYVDYDVAKLTYIGIESNLAGVIANQEPISKTIIISWVSQGANLLPIDNISKYVRLKFAKGWWGNSTMHAHVGFTSYNSNASSLADANGGTVLATWTEGDIYLLSGTSNSYSNEINSAQFSGVNTISQAENNSINVYPNPFSNNTEIDYSLVDAGKVKLSVYNSLGQRVVVLVDESKDAGSYKFNYNTSDLAVGVYSCEIMVNGLKANYRKIIKLVKAN